MVRMVVVPTANVIDTAPSGTTTLPGTDAIEASSLQSDTIAPPAAAGALSVTVPVAGRPPSMLAGATAIAARMTAGGSIASVAVCVTPP